MKAATSTTLIPDSSNKRLNLIWTRVQLNVAALITTLAIRLANLAPLSEAGLLIRFYCESCCW